jgi:cell division protein FtsQ
LSESSQEIDPSPGETRSHTIEGPKGLLRRGGSMDTRAKWLMVVGGSSLALLAAGYVFTRSPMFEARHVEVAGRSHLSRATVLNLADVGRGTNVFWLHTGAVQRRLLADRWIENATVSRSLPSTISIRIEERTPVAVVSDPSGGYNVVASDGTTLGRTNDPASYPALLVNPTRPGGLSLAAQVAGAMDPWLRSHVRAIDARSATLVVQLRSGVPAYYGDATSAAAKDRALGAVLRWALAGQKPIQSIDVRTPLAPTAQLPYTPPTPVPVGSPATSKRTGKHSKASPSASPSPSPSPSPSSGTAKHRRQAGGGH